MKTWEVLKNLDAGATKRYRRLGDGLEIGLEISLGSQLEVYYRWESGHTHLSPLDRWEEVPQEVPWQEALKFWIDGGQIEVWRNDELKYKLGVIKSDECYHFDRTDFTEGKWYIL
jgi:hypothetical protein